jgi:hypothetical protein
MGQTKADAFLCETMYNSVVLYTNYLPILVCVHKKINANLHQVIPESAISTLIRTKITAEE